MQTLEIEIPDSKTRLVKEFLKELGVTVKVKGHKNSLMLTLLQQWMN